MFGDETHLAATKVLICSGKVYYDLLSEREKRNLNDVAIIRSKKRVDVAQHILMLDFPETVDFSLEHEPRGVVSQGAQLDDLDGYFLD